jgi:hypothetical protein
LFVRWSCGISIRWMRVYGRFISAGHLDFAHAILYSTQCWSHGGQLDWSIAIHVVLHQTDRMLLVRNVPHDPVKQKYSVAPTARKEKRRDVGKTFPQFYPTSFR